MEDMEMKDRAVMFRQRIRRYPTSQVGVSMQNMSRDSALQNLSAPSGEVLGGRCAVAVVFRPGSMVVGVRAGVSGKVGSPSR